MKDPCKECPFRRNSAPGWLGEHETSQEIVNIIQFDGFFPCHVLVTGLVEDGVPFEEAAASADHCIGALAFMNNSCKRSRNKDVAKLQDAVGERPDCFSWSHEMKDHHGR